MKAKQDANTSHNLPVPKRIVPDNDLLHLIPYLVVRYMPTLPSLSRTEGYFVEFHITVFLCNLTPMASWETWMNDENTTQHK